MSKTIKELEAEIEQLDLDIEAVRQELWGLADEMDAVGIEYEEGPGLDRNERLRAAMAKHLLLHHERDAADFDLRCRLAWGENWDRVADPIAVDNAP